MNASKGCKNDGYSLPSHSRQFLETMVRQLNKNVQEQHAHCHVIETIFWTK